MIRYDLKLQQGGVYTMRAQPRGRYVKYQDAALLEKQADYDQGRIAELRAQLAEVTRERDENGRMLDQAQAMWGEVIDAAEELQRQLAEVTRERDTLKAMVDLHDAMNDRRRLAQETPHKRRQYENG